MSNMAHELAAIFGEPVQQQERRKHMSNMTNWITGESGLIDASIVRGVWCYQHGKTGEWWVYVLAPVEDTMRRFVVYQGRSAAEAQQAQQTATQAVKRAQQGGGTP